MAVERIRYRRVSTRMWGDRKFRALSAPRPNAQTLWVWLLTGPLTTPVPGVVLTTLSGIAEGLEWPVAVTKRCWQEIADAEMAVADWSNRLVWLPNAVRHNAPANPNVVTGWRQFLDESVPECALRDDLEAAIAAELSSGDRGPSFLKAFRVEPRKASVKPFGKQDQDQDQERTPQPPLQGGRFTREEMTQAKLDRIAFQRAQPAYVAPVHREPGRVYVEPRQCPHEPECTDLGVCLALFAQDRRRRVARALEGPSERTVPA